MRHDPITHRVTRTLVTALGERDEGTRAHCERVVALADLLGRSCGLDGRDLRVLHSAACLHDIGKLGIPDHVLHNPGPLDAESWATMRTHPERGQRILASLGVSRADSVGLAIRHHHEQFDGQGYPDRLAGEAIPVVSRIIAMADTYDAIATRRVYRDAQPHHSTMATMEQERGVKLDPWLFDRFARLIERSPLRAM
ncbi:HD domain-containing protein [Niveibacterium umoris]|uniref:HD-GYP domain-containing protein (C-di-GMP phosphodiesterase class II) n=1 Tax=Niveibacterium umoris TaxID=1193620 RepID=A0A840BPI6_9RHOO|nr:HD domain-containing phosphohydrolase [Niveibacterium umoris]MBB4013592.1 HD-GYP domain-containing protein (c-di-GMP phosphodiesterase class II) [Niveibacterium umoris]